MSSVRLLTTKGNHAHRIKKLGCEAAKDDLSHVQNILRQIAIKQNLCSQTPERPSWANGAFVYLTPADAAEIEECVYEGTAQVMGSPQPRKVELKPYHILVSEVYRGLIDQAMGARCGNGREAYQMSRSGTIQNEQGLDVPAFSASDVSLHAGPIDLTDMYAKIENVKLKMRNTFLVAESERHSLQTRETHTTGERPRATTQHASLTLPGAAGLPPPDANYGACRKKFKLLRVSEPVLRSDEDLGGPPADDCGEDDDPDGSRQDSSENEKGFRKGADAKGHEFLGSGMVLTQSGSGHLGHTPANRQDFIAGAPSEASEFTSSSLCTEDFEEPSHDDHQLLGSLLEHEDFISTLNQIERNSPLVTPFETAHFLDIHSCLLAGAYAFISLVERMLEQVQLPMIAHALSAHEYPPARQNAIRKTCTFLESKVVACLTAFERCLQLHLIFSANISRAIRHLDAISEMTLAISQDNSDMIELQRAYHVVGSYLQQENMDCLAESLMGPSHRSCKLASVLEQHGWTGDRFSGKVDLVSLLEDLSTALGPAMDSILDAFQELTCLGDDVNKVLEHFGVNSCHALLDHMRWEPSSLSDAFRREGRKPVALHKFSNFLQKDLKWQLKKRLEQHRMETCNAATERPADLVGSECSIMRKRILEVLRGVIDEQLEGGRLVQLLWQVEQEMHHPVAEELECVASSSAGGDDSGQRLWQVVVTEDFCKDREKFKLEVQSAINDTISTLAEGIRHAGNHQRVGSDGGKGLVVKMAPACDHQAVIWTQDMRYDRDQKAYIEKLQIWRAVRIAEVKEAAEKIECLWKDSNRRLDRLRESLPKPTKEPMEWKGISCERVYPRSIASAALEDEDTFALVKFFDLHLDAMVPLNLAVSRAEADIITARSGPVVVFAPAGCGKTVTVKERLCWHHACYLSSTICADDQLVSDGGKYDDFRQIFVTFSDLLCQDMYTQFVDSECQRLQTVMSKDELDVKSQRVVASSGQSSENLTDLFSDVKSQDFPLFLCFRKLLKMIDGMLPTPFFPRLRDGSVDRSRVVEASSRGAVQMKVQHRDTFKELTFGVFASEFWRKKGWKNVAPLLVWREIQSFIKGHHLAAESSSGCMSREQYASSVSRRMSSDFRGSRHAIYDIYEQFEKWRKASSYWDRQDVAMNVYKRLLVAVTNSEVDRIRVHQLYIDEVQDLTEVELLVCLQLCPLDGITLTGDTTQTISEGVAFRSCDLRSTLQRLAATHRKQHSQDWPTMHRLETNFRSHDGIVQCCAAIMWLLQAMFPYQMDKQMGNPHGQMQGPRPCLIDSETLSLMFSGLPGIGSDQAVILRDKAWQSPPSMLPSAVRNSPNLGTARHHKGLEYDDVIILNFFADSSESTSKWSIVHRFESEKQSLLGPDYTPLCTELKELFVAASRPKKLLFICEDASSPVIEKLLQSHAIQRGVPDNVLADFHQRAHLQQTATSWRSRADVLFKSKRFLQAAGAYKIAGDLQNVKLCEAYILVAEARKGTKTWSEAALAFQAFPQYSDEYARCLFNAGHYAHAASVFEQRVPPMLFEAAEAWQENQSWQKAEEHYKTLTMYGRAADCLVKSLNKSVRLKDEERQRVVWTFSKAVESEQMPVEDACTHLEDFNLHQNAANIYLSKQMFAEAGRAFSLAQCFFLAGDAYKKGDDNLKAARMWMKLNKNDAEAVSCWEEATTVFIKQNLFNDAADAWINLHDALKFEDAAKSRDAAFNASSCLKQSGEYQRASKWFAEIGYHLTAAQCLQLAAAAKPKQKLDAWMRAVNQSCIDKLDEETDDVVCFEHIAQLHDQMGSPHKAGEWWAKASKYVAAGKSFMDAERWDSALGYLRLAERGLDVSNMIAKCLEKSNLFIDAARETADALSLINEGPDAIIQHLRDACSFATQADEQDRQTFFRSHTQEMDISLAMDFLLPENMLLEFQEVCRRQGVPSLAAAAWSSAHQHDLALQVLLRDREACQDKLGEDFQRALLEESLCSQNDVLRSRALSEVVDKRESFDPLLLGQLALSLLEKPTSFRNTSAGNDKMEIVENALQQLRVASETGCTGSTLLNLIVHAFLTSQRMDCSQYGLEELHGTEELIQGRIQHLEDLSRPAEGKSHLAPTTLMRLVSWSSHVPTTLLLHLTSRWVGCTDSTCIYVTRHIQSIFPLGCAELCSEYQPLMAVSTCSLQASLLDFVLHRLVMVLHRGLQIANDRHPASLIELADLIVKLTDCRSEPWPACGSVDYAASAIQVLSEEIALQADTAIRSDFADALCMLLGGRKLPRTIAKLSLKCGEDAFLSHQRKCSGNGQLRLAVQQMMMGSIGSGDKLSLARVAELVLHGEGLRILQTAGTPWCVLLSVLGSTWTERLLWAGGACNDLHDYYTRHMKRQDLAACSLLVAGKHFEILGNSQCSQEQLLWVVQDAICLGNRKLAETALGARRLHNLDQLTLQALRLTAQLQPTNEIFASVQSAWDQHTCQQTFDAGAMRVSLATCHILASKHDKSLGGCSYELMLRFAGVLLDITDRMQPETVGATLARLYGYPHDIAVDIATRLGEKAVDTIPVPTRSYKKHPSVAGSPLWQFWDSGELFREVRCVLIQKCRLMLNWIMSKEDSRLWSAEGLRVCKLWSRLRHVSNDQSDLVSFANAAVKFVDANYTRPGGRAQLISVLKTEGDQFHNDFKNSFGTLTKYWKDQGWKISSHRSQAKWLTSMLRLSSVAEEPGEASGWLLAELHDPHLTDVDDLLGRIMRDLEEGGCIQRFFDHMHVINKSSAFLDCLYVAYHCSLGNLSFATMRNIMQLLQGGRQSESYRKFIVITVCRAEGGTKALRDIYAPIVRKTARPLACKLMRQYNLKEFPEPIDISKPELAEDLDRAVVAVADDLLRSEFEQGFEDISIIATLYMSLQPEAAYHVKCLNGYALDVFQTKLEQHAEGLVQVLHREPGGLRKLHESLEDALGKFLQSKQIWHNISRDICKACKSRLRSTSNPFSVSTLEKLLDHAMWTPTSNHTRSALRRLELFRSLLSNTLEDPGVPLHERYGLCAKLCNVLVVVSESSDWVMDCAVSSISSVSKTKNNWLSTLPQGITEMSKCWTGPAPFEQMWSQLFLYWEEQLFRGAYTSFKRVAELPAGRELNWHAQAKSKTELKAEWSSLVRCVAIAAALQHFQHGRFTSPLDSRVLESQVLQTAERFRDRIPNVGPSNDRIVSMFRKVDEIISSKLSSASADQELRVDGLDSAYFESAGRHLRSMFRCAP